MSRQNILFIEPSGGIADIDIDALLGAEVFGIVGALVAIGIALATVSCDVGFQCKDGSVRVYRFYSSDAISVMSGSDPAGFRGQRIQ